MLLLIKKNSAGFGDIVGSIELAIIPVDMQLSPSIEDGVTGKVLGDMQVSGGDNTKKSI